MLFLSNFELKLKIRLFVLILWFFSLISIITLRIVTVGFTVDISDGFTVELTAYFPLILPFILPYVILSF